jgi:hypothetical protein
MQAFTAFTIGAQNTISQDFLSPAFFLLSPINAVIEN